jgi:hypothetical protein
MTTKKDPQVTPDGAVELDEAQLDQASGGTLTGQNQSWKLNQAMPGDKLMVKLGDGSVRPISDGTSNVSVKL